MEYSEGTGADGAQIGVAGLGLREEGLQVLAYRAVQDRGGGSAGTIDGGWHARLPMRRSAGRPVDVSTREDGFAGSRQSPRASRKNRSPSSGTRLMGVIALFGYLSRMSPVRL